MRFQAVTLAGCAEASGQFYGVLNLNPLARKIFLLGLAVDAIILDQLSKWAVTELVIRPRLDVTFVDLISWVMQAPEKMPYTSIEVLPFFNIVMVWNSGISFGMFNDGTSTLLLILLPLVITAFFMVWLFRTASWFQGIAIALVIGGAIGNVIDRLRFGAVIDFLDFHIGDIHYPAFNIADSCVVIGIGLLIFHSIFLEKKA